MGSTSIEYLYPVFPEVIKYLRRLHGQIQKDQEALGKRILDLLDNSIVSHLEFHRLWLFSLFAADSGWGNGGRFVSLLASNGDLCSQCKLTLALGQSGQDFWFRARKRSVFEFGPWLRRAFLAGGSCLPTDERSHWYRGLESRLDPLELAVTRWARANPYPQ